ncbi:hypothetical protein QC762_507053 [Podospora pseudocomata]|uniref:2EXR domain-containing protein n=1 Tax=Podospora pseudocomata TaxID=2093779 RepID=A0ABR0GCE8_9PEZI|nr:hypothetical protein QC762_507053 [Podospora pseudocomata]
MASFPQFTRLPTEIQWVIWELALSESNTHFLTMNSGHHSLGQLSPIYGPVPNLAAFGQSLLSLNPSPLSFAQSWSRVSAIASSCYKAKKTAVRLHKKDLESGNRGPFPLFDASQDMLVISTIHAIDTSEPPADAEDMDTSEPEQPEVPEPFTQLTFEPVDSVGHWRRRYPLLVPDLPATGYLANITSVAIYWKPEMDDAVVCRQIQWLWDGDACPKLETIYIDISMRSKRYRWFHCTLQNHVHLAARRRTRTVKGVVDIHVRNLTAF